MYFYSSLLMQF